MNAHYGDYPTGATVYMTFDSFAGATGAPSATSNFANTDVLIYKNGGTTQRTSASGITVTTSFDSQTGLQMVAIDLSDNTDASFYAAGNEYQVAIADVTIDSQTVRFWLGSFSIERANGILALLKATGSVKVDVVKWNSQTVVTPNTNGVPIVDTRQVMRHGTAQSTGNSTTAIKLDASASATTDFYKGHRISIISGTGAPESSICTAYDGSTKIATVSPAWPTAPDNTSVFQVIANSQMNLTEIDAVALSTHASGMIPADIRDVSGSAVSTATAQFGVNVVNFGGTVQTARDIGASVLLSSGSGTGQLDFTSGVVKANPTQINGDANAAAGLAKAARAIGEGTVTTGGSTTSVPTSAFTPAGAVADQFKDRSILFNEDTTTTTLRGVAKKITASSNSATPTLTVETLPDTPVSGDTFTVI